MWNPTRFVVFLCGSFLGGAAMRLGGVVSAEEPPEDAFTIAFVSHLEVYYRNSAEDGRKILAYISEISEREEYFADKYENVRIDPELIIHGGDNNAQQGCGWSEYKFGMCRHVEADWQHVWNAPFERGVPLITAYGNHDWYYPESKKYNHTIKERPLKADIINNRNNHLVAKTYEETEALVGDEFQFQEFSPEEGRIGPSMYRAVFRGVQIANSNFRRSVQSYDGDTYYPSDKIFNALAESLDRSRCLLS